MNRRSLVWLLLLIAWRGAAQEPAPTISLDDALKRARQYGGQIQSANLAALLAREDSVQARAAQLPAVNAFNQFIYTEGNGTPSGVFAANDGVHIYNEQLVVHEEVLSYIRKGEIRRALAAQAVAKAKTEVAARGLLATVIQSYYAIVVAQRKLVNAQSAVREAEHFLDITQKQEKGGEAAHSDVLKAQIDAQQRRRDVQEGELAIEKAKIALGVLIFPNFSRDFNVQDDLQDVAALPAREEAQAQAVATSPDLMAAKATVEQAGYEVSIARYQYLPSFGLDFFYGINANQFAARTDYPAHSEVPYRQNLGYAAQATLNIPIWNWGATRSKVKQAEYKRQQAELDLSTTKRQVDGNVAAYYAETNVARAQIASLKSSVDLASESLRLVLLRYTAGESTSLEVVDAQNTLNLARNAYEDGLARFRTALANLQTLTGRY
jgi:outer membrane protein TolC